MYAYALMRKRRKELNNILYLFMIAKMCNHPRDHTYRLGRVYAHKYRQIYAHETHIQHIPIFAQTRKIYPQMHELNTVCEHTRMYADKR